MAAHVNGKVEAEYMHWKKIGCRAAVKGKKTTSLWRYGNNQLLGKKRSLWIFAAGSPSSLATASQAATIAGGPQR